MSESRKKIHQELNFASARFKSSTTEYSYRQYYFSNDRLQAISIITLMLIPMIAFSYSDYQFFGNSAQFYKLISGRISGFVFSLISIIILLRSKRQAVLDWTMFIWITAVCTLLMYVDSTRPPDSYFYLAVDVALLFSIYTLAPNRLIFQVIPALYLTTGVILISILLKTKSFGSGLGIGIALLFANLFGVWLSWRSQINRRIQYNLLMSERNLRRELQKAFDNIKVLKGLLPFCSSCKKIRDDEGYWHRVEGYIQKHSEAEVSHGICPDCAEKLYGKFFEEEST